MRLKACIEHASHRDDGTGRARSWGTDSLVDGGALRVARIEPRTMRTKPIAMPSVNGSPRSATPSARATAGFTYVITVARGAPTSATRAKNRTNASAVQTTPSTATASSTDAEGSVAGSCASPNGAYATAVTPRDAATTPREGSRSEEHTSELQSRQYLVCRLLLEKK